MSSFQYTTVAIPINSHDKSNSIRIPVKITDQTPRSSVSISSTTKTQTKEEFQWTDTYYNQPTLSNNVKW